MKVLKDNGYKSDQNTCIVFNLSKDRNEIEAPIINEYQKVTQFAQFYHFVPVLLKVFNFCVKTPAMVHIKFEVW